jgi:hypothetical protein
MRNKFHFSLRASPFAHLLALLPLAFRLSLFAQGAAFTYQGRLNDGGNPASGIYDLRFTIYDSTNNPGTIIAGPLTNSATGVSNGLFAVTLDFGAGTFTGADRWLEIAVRSNSAAPFSALSPRQPLTATPYAVRAAQFSGAISASQLPGNVARLDASNQVFTGQVQLNNVSNTYVGSFTGNGSALTNIPGTFRWQLVAGTSQQAQPNTGYVVTNAGQVTITLPTAPAVGDIVRVSGPGAGGWTIAQNAGQAVVGAGLAVFGLEWTPRDSIRFWNSVASSADGIKLAAVEFTGQIYTSADSGVSWTAHESNRTWQAIASSADGRKLVAVASGGNRIYTSTNSGINWDARETNRIWLAVASSADGSKLAAVVLSGQIYMSTNSGVNWTPRDTNRNWKSIASSADGTKLIAGTDGDRLYTSTDSGLSWTPRENSRAWYSVASSADGTKLVAGDFTGQIYTSTDSGVSWTARDTNRTWRALASSADGNILIAGVNNSGQIYVSTDSGASWTARENNREWNCVAASADGSKLVAAYSSGQIYTSTPTPLSSTTVGTAGRLNGGKSTAVELQFIGNGQFLQLSHEGALPGY